MKPLILYKALILFIFLCISIGNLCAQTVSIATNPNPPSICVGGYITLTAEPSGFTGTSYSYLWSPDNDTTASITKSPNSSISYSVTVTEGLQMADTSQMVTVDQPTVGGSVTGGKTQICKGSNTEKMTLSWHVGSVVKWQKSLNGGTWSDISNTTTEYSETPDSAGSWQYRAVVKNGACNTENSKPDTIVVNQTSVDVTQTHTSCGLSNGQATANPSGGIGYTYEWSNGGTTQTISNLSEGTYSVTVTATGGCTAIASTTINGSSGISTTISPTHTSCGLSNGQATANPSGGIGYTYAWSNGGTTQTITGLKSGTYSVTVTSTGGCTATASTTINGSSGISTTISPTHTSCGLANGSATATPSGGSGYTYVWNNGQTTQTISNLSAGTYSVTVTATGGCTATASTTINGSSGITTTATATHTTCGLPNGQATANPSGGSGYTYVWNNGQTIQTISNLSAGTYSVTVTSTGGCTATASTTINGSSGVNPKIMGTTEICLKEKVTLSADTGYSSYSWSNNGGNGQTATFTPSMTTTYTVTVTNANGCSGVANFEVKVNPLPDVSITGVPSEMCYNEVLDITFYPPGGTISCQGCEVNYLELKPMKIGDAKINYQYTNPVTNCKNSIDANFLIKPVPTADFVHEVFPNTKFAYQFTDISKAADLSKIINWSYDFNNPLIMDLMSNTIPSKFNRTLFSGDNKLSLTVKDSNICTATIMKNIFIQSTGCGFSITNKKDTICFKTGGKFITKLKLDSLGFYYLHTVKGSINGKSVIFAENIGRDSLGNLELFLQLDSLIKNEINEIIFELIPLDLQGLTTDCDTIKYPFYLKLNPAPEIILDNSENIPTNLGVITFCRSLATQELTIFDKGNNFGFNENYNWTFENQTFSSSSINISSNSDKAPKTVSLTKTNAPGCVSDNSFQVRFYNYPTITLDTLPCLPYIQIKGLKNEDKIDSINAGKLVPETPFIDITGLQAKTLVFLATNDFCSDTASIDLEGGDNFATIDVNKFQTYTCNGISNFIYPVPGLCYEWGEINDQGVVTFPIPSKKKNQQFIPVKAGSKYFVRVYECDKKDCGKVTEPRSLDEELIDDECLDKKDITIKLFPNPNTGDFTLQLIDGEKGAYHIRIFDVLGRFLFDQWYEHDGKNVAIPFLLHSLNQSFYTMNIQSPKGKVMNLPFLIIR